MQAVAIPMTKRRGRFRLLNVGLYRRVEDAAAEEDPYEMIIRKKKGATISDPMRRYYWAVVAPPIAEASGHSKEVIHESLKLKILGYVDERTGLTIVPSVWSDDSPLEIEEKRAFVDEVRRWAFDFFNLVIPDPQTAVY